MPARPPLPGVATADGTMSVLVLRDAEPLELHREAWEYLALHATEPNPFYEAWALLPALRGLKEGRDLEIVLVYGYSEVAPGIEPVLCGLVPFERRRSLFGLPIRHRLAWRHDYCFSGVPLVRAGREEAFVRALLEDARSRRATGSILRFDQWPAEARLHAALLDTWDRTGLASAIRSRASRAVLRPTVDAETYLDRALAPKRRKEYARLARRFAETGSVGFEVLGPKGDLAPWLDEFLALEAKGWKGRVGTAFARRGADARWLDAVATAAHAGGRLEALALRRDGRAVAMKLNFLAGDGAFAFKIAFDEEWGRFSPGVLLELEGVRRIHAGGRIRWMDSCADPHHPMATRLWSERRVYEDLLVATRSGWPGVVLGATAFASAVRPPRRRRAEPGE